MIEISDENGDYLKGRLLNWKFSTAAEAADVVQDQLDPDDLELIKALGLAFGDVGWFDGNHGTIVRAAVTTLIGDLQ